MVVRLLCAQRCILLFWVVIVSIVVLTLVHGSDRQRLSGCGRLLESFCLIGCACYEPTYELLPMGRVGSSIDVLVFETA